MYQREYMQIRELSKEGGRMGYKVFDIEEVEFRVATDGFQPKFLVNNGNCFLKVQCELNRTLRDDWRVEDIASRICKQLKIYAIEQTPCKVRIKNNKGKIVDRYGVVSKNFEKDGYSFVSYSRMLDTMKIDRNDKLFIRSNFIEKMEILIKNISRFSKINESIMAKYIFDMVIVDMLVLNQDRHFKNFGVFYNNTTCKFEVAMLFDFGMGLFENDNMFDDMDKLSDCMRYSYIAPFGEDPFDMARMLKETKIGSDYLRKLDIGNLNISKGLFVRDTAYEYFRAIKKELTVK